MTTTINPYTQEPIADYPFLTANELHDVLQRSQIAFHQWRKTSLSERIEYLDALITTIQQEQSALSMLISSEMGKPIQESRAELDKCRWLCEYYRENAEKLLAERKEIFVDKTVLHTIAPIGAVFGIMPWNYPFWQVFRYAVPNLLAGNVILLKHAPNTFGCSVALERIFNARAPVPSVFHSLIIDTSQVEYVIAHSLVQGVCLTGSLRAGRTVGALAGKYIKKSILELGSSDAFAVLDTTAMDAALQAAFTSRMLNAGQTCIAAKRIFVPEQKLEYTRAFLQAQLKTIVLGNPLDEQTTMGPIARKEFIPILTEQVNKAREHGAHILHGGISKENFFLPSLMITQHTNSIQKEEIFGPILNVIAYKDEEDVLAMINDSDFGLSASVWSGDIQRAVEFSRHLEVGAVVINDFVKSDPRIPFGGIKLSGYGREMGEQGIKSLSNERTIILSTEKNYSFARSIY